MQTCVVPPVTGSSFPNVSHCCAAPVILLSSITAITASVGVGYIRASFPSKVSVRFTPRVISFSITTCISGFLLGPQSGAGIVGLSVPCLFWVILLSFIEIVDVVGLLLHDAIPLIKQPAKKVL